MNKRKFMHKPILAEEIVEAFSYLGPEKAYFVDGTMGLAGHSIALAKAYPKVEIIGIDKDKYALVLARKNVEENIKEDRKRFTFVHDDFSNIDSVLDRLDIEKIDGALLDLGVSSMQLDDFTRGFSFQDPDQELDMRMNQEDETTAADILNEYTRKQLEQVFARGEAKNFRDIARYTVNQRKQKHYKTVGDFLETLKEAIPKKIQATSKTHFATGAFRALRLEVNQELTKLDKNLENIINKMKKGARLAVITFHSLEDRKVKHTFKRLESPCTCPPQIPACVCGLRPQIKILNRKPIVAKKTELLQNPRSRSAKLRVVEKI